MLFVVNSLKLHFKKRMQCMKFNVKSAILFSIQFLETGLREFGVISSEILQFFFLFLTFYQFVEWIMF